VVTHRRAIDICLLVGVMIGSLVDCSRVPLGDGRQHLPDPFDAVQNTDLEPRFPQQIAQPESSPKTATGASYYGSDSSSGRPAATTTEGAQLSGTGEGYELNFENAPVTTVAKVILGDILGAGYTIDPRVQGTVTIASGRPVPKSDLILVLENALRMSNVVLVADVGGVYRLIPGTDAQGDGATVAADGQSDAGYGISVVPLRYTSAQTMLKLLDGFAIKSGMARADTAHNLILVQGTGPERKSAVDTIMNFDADWMRDQSVGIYPVENATPDAIIKEVESIMSASTGGLNENLVTLEPIMRLNAVLVVSKKPGLLRQTALWISRLDKADNAGAGVRVYRLRYADARQVAKTLSDLFGSKSEGLDASVNQIAPGAGATSTSSDELGSGANANSSFASNQSAGLGTNPGSATAGASPSAGLGMTSSASGGAGSQTGRPGIAGELGGDGTQDQQGTTSLNLPGLRVAADVANNSLLIYANQENYRLIEQTLDQLDRPQLQVAIHATIAEVTLNNDLQYGVEYYLQGSSVNASFNTLTASTESAAGSAVSQTLAAVLPGGNFLLGPQSSPKIVINALRALTDVKVLSSPSVVVLDNQLATLLVGDQVPVETASANVLAATTSSSSTVVNSINYINTGVILHVLPRVNANGTVVLDVAQEVSGVENTSSAQSLTPTVSQRQVKSTIAVASGQTVLLGGLITETQQRTRNGIPVLEELPNGIGNLFSTNDRSTQRTEIIIFIQPEIIRNGVDAAKVAEELRAKLRGSADAAFQPGPSLFSHPEFAQ
jgi:general secretion pathway protein D